MRALFSKLEQTIKLPSAVTMILQPIQLTSVVSNIRQHLQIYRQPIQFMFTIDSKKIKKHVLTKPEKANKTNRVIGEGDDYSRRWRSNV